MFTQIQFAKNANGDRPTINVEDFFTLYELEITRRGESAPNDVDIVATVTGDDRIQLTFKEIKVNNKNRDYDYVLEVKNLSDMNGNRMDREYLDFVVQRQSDDFDVVISKIRPNTYFNRKGVEIVLEFNDIVNPEEASNAKNYYLNNKLKVDEAIVERDGKTVSLIVYDKAALIAAYEVLEISPRVQALAWPYPSVQNRYWDLATETEIADNNTALPEKEVKVSAVNETQKAVKKIDAAAEVKSSNEGIAIESSDVTTKKEFNFFINVGNVSTKGEFIVEANTPATTPNLTKLVDDINAAKLGVTATENSGKIDLVADKAVDGMTIILSNVGAANIVSIQKLLGHSDLRTTSVYLNQSLDDLKDAVSLL